MFLLDFECLRVFRTPNFKKCQSYSLTWHNVKISLPMGRLLFFSFHGPFAEGTLIRPGWSTHMRIKLSMVAFHVSKHFVSRQHGTTMIALHNIFDSFESKVNVSGLNRSHIYCSCCWLSCILGWLYHWFDGSFGPLKHFSSLKWRKSIVWHYVKVSLLIYLLMLHYSMMDQKFFCLGFEVTFWTTP